jgi:hypothetical protein
VVTTGIPRKDTVQLVAEITQDNPELVAEFLVVTTLIDGSFSVARYGCCLPHQLTELSRAMVDNPDLMKVHPAFVDGHQK